VLRREAVQAGLLPGEILDKNRIEIDKRRLIMLGFWTGRAMHTQACSRAYQTPKSPSNNTRNTLPLYLQNNAGSQKPIQCG
jgi:hypothetical protein